MNDYSVGDSHMFQNWIEELKATPDRLKSVPTRARRQAHRVKTTGRGSLWTARITALETAETFFASAPDNVPVLSRVADAAERATQDRLEAHTRVCLYDYETLTAKKAIAAISGIGHIELLRVQRLEQSTKGRKTVLSAIENALSKTLQTAPETLAA